jgi:hypothetical protein
VRLPGAGTTAGRLTTASRRGVHGSRYFFRAKEAMIRSRWSFSAGSVK